MLKRYLLILALLFVTPSFADFDPMSEEPITSVEEFWGEESKPAEPLIESDEFVGNEQEDARIYSRKFQKCRI